MEQAIQQILMAFQEFVQAENWTTSQEIVASHPELLTDAAVAIIQQLIEQQDNQDFIRIVTEHYQLLSRCREVGIEQAFAEKTGRNRGGMSNELGAILQQITQLNTIPEMPQKVALCQQALGLVQRSENAELWAALQVELGNSLAQNPLGDRADNLEQAIAAYSAALEVRTREAMPVQWASTQNNLAAAYSDRIRGDRADNWATSIANNSDGQKP
ncbi:MAG TPA: hypothetical protein DCF68_19380 [Cyanothece sp. UBA12306]|nr:hypothetical protein [Cyanothece sp. UBA12306]